jgi:galliderm_ABC: lantibiotic protection ABC transporter, ATP-binding subunit
MDLTIDRLSKQFGAKIAVDRVSARLVPGVYGLLGANGAGKTTLMRMVCDVLRPTSGEIRFDGRDVRLLGDEYRARLGYLPQDFRLLPRLHGARLHVLPGGAQGARPPRRAEPLA